jgi:hypothetical protein
MNKQLLITSVFIVGFLCALTINCSTGKVINQSNQNTNCNLLGLELEQITEILGTPTNINDVNSKSAKTQMPGYLYEYLNSADTMVVSRLCRWISGNNYKEIAFKMVNGKWIAFGEYNCIINKEP